MIPLRRASPQEEHLPPRGESLSFSLPAFWISLAGYAVLCAGIAGWLFISADSTLEDLESRLVSRTIPLTTAPISPQTQIQTQQPEPQPEQEDFDRWPSGLVKAPVARLLSGGDPARVPIMDGDLRAFDVYRRPFDPDSPMAGGEKPRGFICLVLMDFGLSKSASDYALSAFPPEISFALSAYADTPAHWRETARRKGHEIWLTLPAEPRSYPQDDAGADSLLGDVSLEENQRRLRRVLARVSGYAGVIPVPDSVFFHNEMVARPIVSEIYERGLGFVDPDPEQRSILSQAVALRLTAPYAHNDVRIDARARPEDIRAALRRLERLALERGMATGFFTAIPLSFQEIEQWITHLPKQQIALAPLSAQASR